MAVVLAVENDDVGAIRRESTGRTGDTDRTHDANDETHREAVGDIEDSFRHPLTRDGLCRWQPAVGKAALTPLRRLALQANPQAC